MISTAMFATANAFAPKANVAFRHAGTTRAFSRATSALMANPQGPWMVSKANSKFAPVET